MFASNLLFKRLTGVARASPFRLHTVSMSDAMSQRMIWVDLEVSPKNTSNNLAKFHTSEAANGGGGDLLGNALSRCVSVLHAHCVKCATLHIHAVKPAVGCGTASGHALPAISAYT